MRVKYNRVSTFQQSGERFTIDQDQYDLVLMDKVSGSIPFKDRPKGKDIVQLVENGTLSELVVEEFSRLGRNTGDIIQTLEWLDGHQVNVFVKNIGLQSRPNGDRNPIWKMISSVMSSLYEMELDNIKERTAMGRMVYVQNGGRLGRPERSTESEKQFLEKDKTQTILKYLNKGRPIREICKLIGTSSKTVQKAKRIGEKYGVIALTEAA